MTLDAKGRLAMPARYREHIAQICAGQMVLTVDQDGCLLVYPRPTWEIVQQRLVALPNLDIQAKDLRRRMIGHADDQDIDAAGRIRVSETLRDFAELKRKVVLVGQGTKFELWDEERWADDCENWRQGKGGGGEISEALASLTW